MIIGENLTHQTRQETTDRQELAPTEGVLWGVVETRSTFHSQERQLIEPIFDTEVEAKNRADALNQSKATTEYEPIGRDGSNDPDSFPVRWNHFDTVAVRHEVATRIIATTILNRYIIIPNPINEDVPLDDNDPIGDKTISNADAEPDEE